MNKLTGNILIVLPSIVSDATASIMSLKDARKPYAMAFCFFPSGLKTFASSLFIPGTIKN